MRKIFYCFIAAISFFIFVSFFNSKLEAKTVTLGNKQYNVNVSNEYQSNNQVEWILITSDRTEGSRVSVEMDIKFIKECSNSTGLVNYSALKAWINKLEEAYDYFCELNLDPIDSNIVIEWTGVSTQYASAYVTSGSNRIVMNKEYHVSSLRRLQQASEKGIMDINGTVLHEMGHKFARSYFGINDSSKDYWNVGAEYINLIMVQYVLDKLVQNNDNIISSVYSSYNYLVGSSGISETGYDDLIEGRLRHIEVSDHYYKSWENIKLKSGYENTGDPTYVDVLYNFSKIFDNIGLEAMKDVFNTYFTEEINNYNTTTVFDKFITLMELAQSHSSEEDWNKISENYEWLYNKFVVKITASNVTVVKNGETFALEYNVSYYSGEHEQLTPTFSTRNSSIATIDNNGNVSGIKERYNISTYKG